MECKGIIFDLDGTLLNTIDDISDAVNNALNCYGFPTRSVNEYKRLVGAGIYNLAESSLPEDVDKDFIPVFVKRIEDEYQKCWNNKTGLYDGIPELLDYISFQRIPMAVFSNKPHEFTILNIVHFLKSWKFAAVFGAQRGIPRKPSPEISLKIASIMNLSPKDMFHVGDTAIDIDTALAAGMVPIGAGWGFRPYEELVSAGAKLVFNTPGEFMGFLKDII